MKSASILACVLVVIAIANVYLVSAADVRCNDDTYIYFTYARNIVEGRGIAYDGRGIPSEGFTSALYLTLLLPFEAAGVNMMFAAIVLNLVGIAALVAAAVALGRHEGLVAPGFEPLLAAVLLLLICFDANVVLIVGRALETMLAPAAALFAVYCGVRAVGDETTTGRQRRWWTAAFLTAAFLAFLVRPESLAALGCVGLVLLWLHPNRRQLLMHTAVFVLALAAWFVGRWLVFGDFLPTPFYRKMAVPERFPGTAYVFGAIREYRLTIALAVAAWIALALGTRWTAGKCRQRAPMMLLVLTVASVLVVFNVHPTIGYGYRFLINATVCLYVILALAATRVVQGFLPAGRSSVIAVCAVSFVLAASPFLVHFQQGRRPGEVVQRLNLYDRAEGKAADHLYLRFGRYLREHLSQPEKMTLVFGDVGCVPYASGCRIVDTNGLTEPYVVKLILEKDPQQRLKRFVDYVMSWTPDLIVIGYGESTGTIDLMRNPHSLFQRDPRIGIYAGFREHGVKYLCSMHSYSDLHFGVRPGSPHFAEVAQTVLDYCQENGYVLPQGLTVVEDGESVNFPRVTPAEFKKHLDDAGRPKPTDNGLPAADDEQRSEG